MALDATRKTQVRDLWRIVGPYVKVWLRSRAYHTRWGPLSVPPWHQVVVLDNATKNPDNLDAVVTTGYVVGDPPTQLSGPPWRLFQADALAALGAGQITQAVYDAIVALGRRVTLHAVSVDRRTRIGSDAGSPDDVTGWMLVGRCTSSTDGKTYKVERYVGAAALGSEAGEPDFAAEVAL